MRRRALLLLPLFARPARAETEDDITTRDWAALSRDERTRALRRLRAGQKAREAAAPEALGARWDALSPGQRAELLTAPRSRGRAPRPRG
jgi:hypothetical protein